MNFLKTAKRTDKTEQNAKVLKQKAIFLKKWSKNKKKAALSVVYLLPNRGSGSIFASVLRVFASICVIVRRLTSVLSFGAVWLLFGSIYYSQEALRGRDFILFLLNFRKKRTKYHILPFSKLLRVFWAVFFTFFMIFGCKFYESSVFAPCFLLKFCCFRLVFWKNI